VMVVGRKVDRVWERRCFCIDHAERYCGSNSSGVETRENIWSEVVLSGVVLS
jgi:hypothetical protein